MLRTTYLLLLLLYTGLTSQAQRQASKSPAAYHLTGRCHDYGTALGLKAAIYAIIDGKRQKLGEGIDDGKFEAKTGTFDVLLPVTATCIMLEMAGYRPVDIPVHFAPNIPDGASFAFYNLAAMTPLDTPPTSVPAPLVDFISLCFVETDSVASGTWFELTSSKSSNRIIVPGLSPSGMKAMHFPILPGAYKATLSTANGQTISTDQFNVGTGVTFKAIRLGKKPAVGLPKVTAITERTPPAKSAAPSDTATQASPALSQAPAVVTAPTTATLYFDQSSPDLRTQTRASLDSLAPILTAQPVLRATITGYTDNVGQRSLNLTLSEYRARAVATYLTGRGVPAEQLIVRWRGPDSTASAVDSETLKVKSRRVLIQVAPR